MGKTQWNIKIYDTSWANVLYSDDTFSSTTTIASILQWLQITEVSNTIWWTAIDSSLSTLSAYNTYGDGNNNLNLYSIMSVETVGYFMRNWTKYEFESNNWVPSVWTNWQVLTVVSWAAAWANAPASWIQNDTTWTTTTVSAIRAGSEAEYNALSTKSPNIIYHIY